MTIDKFPENLRHQIQSIKSGDWLFDWQRQAPTPEQSALLDFLSDEKNCTELGSTEETKDKVSFSLAMTKAALLRMKLSATEKSHKKTIQDQLASSLDSAAHIILDRVELAPDDQWNKDALLHVYCFVVLGDYKSESFTRVKSKCTELKLIDNLLDIPELSSKQISVLWKLGYKYSEGKKEEGFGQDFKLAHDYLYKSFVSAKKLIALNQSSDDVTLWHIGLIYTLILENAIKQQTKAVPLSDQQQLYLQQSLDSDLSLPRFASSGFCFGLFSMGSTTDVQSHNALGAENPEIEKNGLRNFYEKQPILLFRLIQIQLIETLKLDNAMSDNLETLKSNVTKLLIPGCFARMFNCSPILDKRLTERLRLLRSCHQEPSSLTNWPAELKDKDMSDFIDELFVPARAYLENLSSTPNQLVVSGAQRI